MKYEITELSSLHKVYYCIYCSSSSRSSEGECIYFIVIEPFMMLSLWLILHKMQQRTNEVNDKRSNLHHTRNA